MEKNTVGNEPYIIRATVLGGSFVFGKILPLVGAYMVYFSNKGIIYLEVIRYIFLSHTLYLRKD